MRAGSWAHSGRGARPWAPRSHVCLDTILPVCQVMPDGKKRVYDEYGGMVEVDKVIFACACNAIGNMAKKHNWLEDTLLAVPECVLALYAIVYPDARLLAHIRTPHQCARPLTCKCAAQLPARTRSLPAYAESKHQAILSRIYTHTELSSCPECTYAHMHICPLCTHALIHLCMPACTHTGTGMQTITTQERATCTR